MTTHFVDRMFDETNLAYTENGGVANATTKSNVLDFFAQGGAIRGLAPEEQVKMFVRAFSDDPLLALKAMFYFRDVRGGQGQRAAFRNQIRWLADNYPDMVRRNMHLIPEYGRWDDLYALDGTKVSASMYSFLGKTLKSDFLKLADSKDRSMTLAAKWAKSENASSAETRRLGRKTRESMGLTPRQYRKLLSAVRERLRVVERDMSQKNWGDIKYETVPSNAMMKYRKAFYRNDETRFSEYVSSVKSGDVKINSSVLYPHEIVGKVLYEKIDGDLAQAMWDNLPNYLEGVEDQNAICVVDVSGSMYGTPIQVAIALGMYYAERAIGPYKDHFITFSVKPQMQRIMGDTLVERVACLRDAHWDMNTNIEAVFDLILSIAIKHNLSPSEIPKKLYIISDMEFDSVGLDTYVGVERLHRTSGDRVFDVIREKFDNAGYPMPHLVFWNVDARNVQFPMNMDDRGFQVVSGFSPSILKHVMSDKFVSPYDLMLEVLNSDRYSVIL